MTRRKKTRSLADKVTIRTGRRKDYKQWRHDNPDQVAPSRRFTQKKRQQRKIQAMRRLERQQSAPDIDIHPQRQEDTAAPTTDQSNAPKDGEE